MVLRALAVAIVLPLVYTWPMSQFSSSGLMHRRDVSDCAAVPLDVPKAKESLNSQCNSFLEAIDGLTDYEWNGWGTFQTGSTKKQAKAMVPLLKKSTTNGATFLLEKRIDKKAAVSDVTLEYTTDKKPKLNSGNWQAFPNMATDDSGCTVSGADLKCSSSNRNLAVTWADTDITGVRITVNKPKKFLLTEFTLHNC